jgi:hypothetical protein
VSSGCSANKRHIAHDARIFLGAFSPSIRVYSYVFPMQWFGHIMQLGKPEREREPHTAFHKYTRTHTEGGRRTRTHVHTDRPAGRQRKGDADRQAGRQAGRGRRMRTCR